MIKIEINVPELSEFFGGKGKLKLIMNNEKNGSYFRFSLIENNDDLTCGVQLCFGSFHEYNFCNLLPSGHLDIKRNFEFRIGYKKDTSFNNALSVESQVLQEFIFRFFNAGYNSANFYLQDYLKSKIK